MRKRPVEIRPNFVTIAIAASRIAENGYGTAEEWEVELVAAAKMDKIDLFDYKKEDPKNVSVQTILHVFDLTLYLWGQFDVDLYHWAKGSEPGTSDTGLSSELAATAKSTSESHPANVVPNDAGPGVRKRNALVEEYRGRWPTIERDLRSASENGLSKVAKCRAHGHWNVMAALDWARQRGKFQAEILPAPVNSVFDLCATKHTMGR